MNKRLAIPNSFRGLYLITDDVKLDDPQLDRITCMIADGLPVLQYRRKHASSDEKLDDARKLADLCRTTDTVLIINDDPELTHQVGAHGVHLGESDARVEDAREYLGTGFIIGQSCYADIDLAHAAMTAGADYVAFGSFFPSHTKPAATPVTLEILTRAKTTLDLPIVAIGGITLESARQLFLAQTDMVAVMRDVWDHPDPVRRVREFLELCE
ncbi:MAG: thiamine phosphate synthase [Gammaproteobacteria bacterium]